MGALGMLAEASGNSLIAGANRGFLLKPAGVAPENVAPANSAVCRAMPGKTKLPPPPATTVSSTSFA